MLIEDGCEQWHRMEWLKGNMKSINDHWSHPRQQQQNQYQQLMHIYCLLKSSSGTSTFFVSRQQFYSNQYYCGGNGHGGNTCGKDK